MKKEVEKEKEESNQVPYKDFPNIKNDVSLVKIDSKLYDEVVEIVESEHIDYPSIKNFVEVAVRNQVNMIKFDIENRGEILTPTGKLKNTGINEFTACVACNKLFLNDKVKNKLGRKVCPKCTQMIKNLNKLVD